MTHKIIINDLGIVSYEQEPTPTPQDQKSPQPPASPPTSSPDLPNNPPPITPATLTTLEKAQIMCHVFANNAQEDSTAQDWYDMYWEGCQGYKPPNNGTDDEYVNWEINIENEWLETLADQDTSIIQEWINQYL